MGVSKLPVEYAARLTIWRQFGWTELPTAEEDRIWHRFESSFGFFGSGIREPDPSLTWDIGGMYEGGDDEFRRLESDLNAKSLRALTACTAPGELVYALDWQHSCFSFDPRGGVRTGDPDDWAVPVLPSGDHYLFLARDLRFGIIGHMDTSVCVFGEQLLAELATDPPVAFTRLLRRDGRPVAV